MAVCPNSGSINACSHNRPALSHVHPMLFMMPVFASLCAVPAVIAGNRHAECVSAALAMHGPKLLHPREAPQETFRVNGGLSCDMSCNTVSGAGIPPVIALPAVANSSFVIDASLASHPGLDRSHVLNTCSRDGMSTGGAELDCDRRALIAGLLDCFGVRSSASSTPAACSSPGAASSVDPPRAHSGTPSGVDQEHSIRHALSQSLGLSEDHRALYRSLGSPENRPIAADSSPAVLCLSVSGGIEQEPLQSEAGSKPNLFMKSSIAKTRTALSGVRGVPKRAGTLNDESVQAGTPSVTALQAVAENVGDVAMFCGVAEHVPISFAQVFRQGGTKSSTLQASESSTLQSSRFRKTCGDIGTTKSPIASSSPALVPLRSGVSQPVCAVSPVHSNTEQCGHVKAGRVRFDDPFSRRDRIESPWPTTCRTCIAINRARQAKQGKPRPSHPRSEHADHAAVHARMRGLATSIEAGTMLMS